MTKTRTRVGSGAVAMPCPTSIGTMVRDLDMSSLFSSKLYLSWLQASRITGVDRSGALNSHPTTSIVGTIITVVRSQTATSARKMVRPGKYFLELREDTAQVLIALLLFSPLAYDDARP